MFYAKVKDNQLVIYPYGFSQLQADNPYTNFGGNGDIEYWFPLTEQATKYGCNLASVNELPIPQYDATKQNCVKNTAPTLVNGTWTLGWTVTNFTPEEQAQADNQRKANVKSQAEGLLAATDWTQVADVPLLNKQAFVDYRTAVRAIALNPPVQATFPEIPAEQWS
jgi:hypothetical protein